MRQTLMLCCSVTALSLACLGQTDTASQAPAPAHRTVFSVRYVAQGAVYIDAGSADGIAPGMTIEIWRHEPGSALLDRQAVATASVTAVATASAVCEIQSKTLDPEKGDEALLAAADEVSRVRADLNQTRRHYLQLLEFTDDDPLDDELREYVPRPPLEEVNRLRGQIAFEQTAIIDHDTAAASSSQSGAVVRVDWSRIGGSYWTLTGYWVMNVDKNPAYPAAVEALKVEGFLPRRVRLRQCKYHNNVIEQDHRTVKSGFGCQRLWIVSECVADAAGNRDGEHDPKGTGEMVGKGRCDRPGDFH